MVGKTQREFAILCSVSQSLIAKIEGGRVDPSYSVATGIFGTLEGLESKNLEIQQKTTKEVMTSKIVSVQPEDTIGSAADKMIKFNISQLPVIAGKSVVGGITESNILAHKSDDDKAKKVVDVMNGIFPMVDKDTKLSTVKDLLYNEPAVLVYDKSKLIGIITKHDLIKTI